MKPEQIATLEASLAEAKQKADEAGGTDESLNQAVKDADKALSDAKPAPVPSQPPKKFTRVERLKHARGKIDEELSELGAAGEGVNEDDKPLTLGDLKRIEADKAKDTALQMADAIEDEDERKQVKEILEHRITPSGNAAQDLALARGAVNALKTAQIAEELARKGDASRHAAAPGGPGRHESQFTPTAEEARTMRPPYNLTEDDIKKSRERAAAKRQ